MKIGIITFHRAVNYGAVLQAYALQEIIEKMGHKAEIIDYRSPKIEKDASPFVGFRNGSAITTAVKRCIFRLRKNVAFHFFFRKYINLSPKVVKKADLEKIADNYDIIFTGSDQVWNIGCTENDTTYFLDFVKDSKKKNAYAVSFGSDELYENGLFDYKRLMNDFNSISVREKSGVDIVNHILDREATLVLDPTLLLTSEDWESLVKKRPINEKYIFVYYLRPPKNLIEYISKLADRTGYKIIDAKSSKSFFMKNSPIDFLTWIYHSEYFVTNSFHGTVFSLVFKKQFMVELNNKFDVNNRSKALLDLVNLDRDISLDTIGKIDEEIDYSIVDDILAEQRKKSLDFLSNAIYRS